MFFAVRVNSSIAMLGVDPRVFNDSYRQMGQDLGLVNGASPQEVALVLVSHLQLSHRVNANPVTAKQWIRKRKINPRYPSIRDALFDLGWDELTEY